MAVSAAAVKAAVAVLKDKRLRKSAGKAVLAVVAVPVVVIVLLLGLLSAATEHNTAAVKLCFNDEAIPAQLPEEYAEHIKSMRSCFRLIDTAIGQLPLEGELDGTRVKAVFYALYFDSLTMNTNVVVFVDCFVRYETRTEEVETTDENGDAVIETVEYTVAVPVGITAAYINLATVGIGSTEEQRDNAAAIYRIIAGGGGVRGVAVSVNMSDAELYELAAYYGVTLPDADTLSAERRSVLKAAFAGVEINIPYHYDWRSYYRLAPGIEGNDFWSEVPADHKGRTSKGTDCSGFVGWAYQTGGITWSGFAFNEYEGRWYFKATPEMRACGSMREIEVSELTPGDIGFLSNTASGTADHAGIYLGAAADGTRLWLHCAGSSGAVCSSYGFKVFYAVRDMDQTYGAADETVADDEAQ